MIVAGVLTGLGIALVHGASCLSGRPSLDRFVRYGPLVSATVIAAIGALMLGQGAAASTLHAPSIIVTALVLAAIAGFAFSPGHVHSHDHSHEQSSGRNDQSSGRMYSTEGNAS